jgi:hypothetical protein
MSNTKQIIFKLLDMAYQAEDLKMLQKRGEGSQEESCKSVVLRL